MTARAAPEVTADQLERAGRVWAMALRHQREAIAHMACHHDGWAMVAEFEWANIGHWNQKEIVRGLCALSALLQLAARPQGNKHERNGTAGERPKQGAIIG